MKLIHLLPLLSLGFNYSANLAPAQPDADFYTSFGIVHNDRSEDEEMIPWKSARKLTWDDFLCAPQKQGDAVASTSTSLGLSYQVKNGLLTYRITCGFSKLKSWGSLKTDYILAHEQAHFDITELHARKLYNALLQYNFNKENFKDDISKIYEQIVQEKENMQATYDRETDHSRLKQHQAAWLNAIDGMLENTQSLSMYP